MGAQDAHSNANVDYAELHCLSNISFLRGASRPKELVERAADLNYDLPDDARVADFYTRCRAEGFVPYAAHNDRDLDEIVTFDGAGWTNSQPAPGCVDCTGDINGDAIVDLSDLAILLANYDATGAQPEDGDLDADSDVDLSDLAMLLAVYGQVCT